MSQASPPGLLLTWFFSPNISHGTTFEVMVNDDSLKDLIRNDDKSLQVNTKERNV